MTIYQQDPKSSIWEAIFICLVIAITALSVPFIKYGRYVAIDRAGMHQSDARRVIRSLTEKEKKEIALQWMDEEAIREESRP